MLSNTASNASLPLPDSTISVYSCIDIPSMLNASRAAPVATGSSFNRDVIMLIDDAACSGATPNAMNELANADNSLWLIPKDFAIAPALILTVNRSCAVAAVLLDRWFITSPTLVICSIGTCSTFDNFAIEVLASSDVISNAIDILDAISANCASFSLGTPN